MAINSVILLVSNQENDKRKANAFPARPYVTSRITTRADKAAVLVRNWVPLDWSCPLFSWKLIPHCRVLQFSFHGSYRADGQFALHGGYRAGRQVFLSPRELQRRQTVLSPRELQSRQAFASPRELQKRHTVLSPRELQRMQTVLSPRELQSRQAFLSPRELQRRQTVLSPRELQRWQKVLSSRELQRRQTVLSPRELQRRQTVLSPRELQSRQAASNHVKSQNFTYWLTARFKPLTAASQKIQISLDITPRSLVNKYRRFEGSVALSSGSRSLERPLFI